MKITDNRKEEKKEVTGAGDLYFKYEYYKTMEEVRKHIQNDEGHCVQQVSYSTFHDCLTQINFTEKIIRSNLRI